MRVRSWLVIGTLLAVGCGQSVAPSVAPSPSPSPSKSASAPTETPGPTPTPSATPGLIGRVAFTRYGTQQLPQIWVGCADLSRVRRLTADPKGSEAPVWSPDGAHIAFDSAGAIYTMTPFATDLLKLTEETVTASDPAYAPDGKRIAFGSTTGIALVDVAGGAPSPVATLPAGFARDSAPRFSPDGKEIVFTREKDNAHHSLMVVATDGSGLREIPTPDLSPTEAAWSPDGTYLVFAALSPAFPFGSLWLVKIDGTGLTNLVPNATTADSIDGFAAPVWPAPGPWIMLMHALVKNAGVQREGLAVIKPDGSGLAWVTDGRGGEHQPDWNLTPC